MVKLLSLKPGEGLSIDSFPGLVSVVKTMALGRLCFLSGRFSR
ncbi:hypothetical protein [Spongorhabdus nitratireducens]